MSVSPHRVNGRGLTGTWIGGPDMAERIPAPQLFEELAALETDKHVLWPRCRTVGYGAVRLDGRAQYTHRLALARRIAMPTDRTYACHVPGLSCPRHCMNYRHLYWGTHAGNMADKIVDGTSLRGEHAVRATLTDGEAREIRRLYETEHLSYGQLADRFGVGYFTVRAVVKRRTWAWLE